MKDFRDIRGDALFGKRTFLVRHGRSRTCVFSAVFLTVGTLALGAVRGATMTYAGGEAVFLALALFFLRALSTDGGVRRDEALISAIAISGRGAMVMLLAHLSIRAAHWPAAAYQAVMISLVLIIAGQALTMARRGPSTRLRVPPEFGRGGRLSEHLDGTHVGGAEPVATAEVATPTPYRPTGIRSRSAPERSVTGGGFGRRARGAPSPP